VRRADKGVISVNRQGELVGGESIAVSFLIMGNPVVERRKQDCPQVRLALLI
jgi:hypothetical protein